MFKRKGKLILIIAIIIQLTIPFSMLFYQININYNLNKEENYFKIPLRNIYYFSDGCSLEIDSENYISYNLDDNFLVFEKNENNISYEVSDFKPKHNNYLYINTSNNLYDLNYVPEYDFNYELIEYSNIIYDKDNEEANIARGLVEGPETEAYATVSIYKGHIKVIKVYIENYTLEEYLKACDNNLIDLKRYQYVDEFNFSEYFDNLSESQKELLNNLAENILK
ncbi:MAG: hypothetical protein E7557_08380 [Ruminococcaceae bacterium]|nr:hypothetical protein [Oscillospiraceae bacterium]